MDPCLPMICVNFTKQKSLVLETTQVIGFTDLLNDRTGAGGTLFPLGALLRGPTSNRRSKPVSCLATERVNHMCHVPGIDPDLISRTALAVAVAYRPAEFADVSKLSHRRQQRRFHAKILRCDFDASVVDDMTGRTRTPRDAAGKRGVPTAVGTIRLDTESRTPLPGTILVRKYKGRDLQVKVLEKGFEYQGDVYKSLSAVAKHITGSHCNGFLFFKLTRSEQNG